MLSGAPCAAPVLYALVSTCETKVLKARMSECILRVVEEIGELLP